VNHDIQAFSGPTTDVRLVRPLSTPQRAFWEKQTPGADAQGVIVGLSIDIHAPVQPDLFEAAAQALIDQSDALRTSFERIGGVLRQVVMRDVPVSFRTLDLSGPSETDETRTRAVEEWSNTPFDLAVAPLIDHLLVRVAPAQWTWHCRCHHLVVDAAGAAVGIAAILETYGRLAAGEAADLSRLGSYVDHLQADAAYVASDRYRQDLVYWMTRHATLPERLFRHGEGQPARVTPLQHVVDRARYDELLDACRADDVQPFHAFVAALGALTYRLFGRTTLSLGLATHNRTDRDRHTVGLFAGTMAFRLEIVPAESLTDLARRASRQLRRDYRHARLPLNHLAAAIGAGDAPLFDIALSFQPASYEMDVNGARVRLRSGIFAGMDTEPAAIHIRDPQGDSPLGVDLTHRSDLVHTGDVVRLYDRFVQLLGAWPGVRAIPIEHLSLDTSP
jgi:hypothetical protein